MKNWPHRKKIKFVVAVGVIAFCGGLALMLHSENIFAVNIVGALTLTTGVVMPTIQVVFDLGF